MKEGKYAKKLTVRVTQDQYDFLQRLDNASEWLRNAIDARMFEETTDAFAVTRKIEYLEREKERIYNSEEYELAKIAENSKFTELYQNLVVEHSHQEVNGDPPIGFGYERSDSGSEIYYRIYSMEVNAYFPHGGELITQTDLQDFISENKLEVGYRSESEYDRDVMLKFFEKFKGKIRYMRALYSRYTAKLAEIQAEIKSLRQKLIEEG